MISYKKIVTMHSVLRVSFGLFLVCLTGGGCEEKKVPFVVDEDEIRRYIDETSVGREFFRVDSLIMPDTFRIPTNTDTLYRVLVDSVTRLLVIDVTPDSVGKKFLDGVLPTPSGNGWRDAEVEVEDRLFLRTQKTTATDTVYESGSVTLKRRGWFVKYGDDGEPYVGWLLFGFNGSGPFAPATTTLTAPNNYIARGDTLTMTFFRYQRLVNFVLDTTLRRTDFVYHKITDTTKILKIPSAITLDLVSAPVSDLSQYQLLTFVDGSGMQTSAMTLSSDEYAYALPVQSGLSGSWRLLVFYEARNGVSKRIWCVPFRLR